MDEAREVRGSMPPVSILGAGVVSSPEGEHPSHAELLFRATRGALDDAGLERDDITTAVTASYDYVEGRPLANQFTLDSIGGTMKACDLRVGDDGIHAIAAGVSLALADPGSVVVVASVQLFRSEHSAETHRGVEEITFDPVFGRPIVAGSHSPQALAFGLRAQAYMARHGATEEDLAGLVARRSSSGNGSRRSAEEILDSTVVAGPIRELHRAPATDVAATLLISAEPRERVRGTVRGVGWSSFDARFGGRDLAEDLPTRKAAADAYARASVDDPAGQLSRLEIYNVYGIDEIQATEALGLAAPGGAVEALAPGGDAAVNPTGGVQAAGWAPAASSLAAVGRALDEMQDAGDVGLLVGQGWSGCGGCSSAVAVIEPAAAA